MHVAAGSQPRPAKIVGGRRSLILVGNRVPVWDQFHLLSTTSRRSGASSFQRRSTPVSVRAAAVGGADASGNSHDWRVPDSLHQLRKIADQGMRSGRCQADDDLDV
jgi:hypothetical protein